MIQCLKAPPIQKNGTVIFFQIFGSILFQNEEIRMVGTLFKILSKIIIVFYNDLFSKSAPYPQDGKVKTFYFLVRGSP